jgi:molecular chaperone DnaJ
MSAKRDYYEILGVPKDADKDTIKKAYRKLALQFHPDRNPEKKEQAEAKFKEINEAAEVLLTDDKRRTYDQFGHAGMQGQPGSGGFGGFGQDFDLGDIFGDIFGDFMGGAGPRKKRGGRARAGEDIGVELTISFRDAVFGAKKNIVVNREVTCTHCDGIGGKKGTGPSTCPTCAGHGQVRRQQGFFSIQTTCPHCHGTGQIIKEPCPECAGHGRKRKKSNIEVSIPAGIDSGQKLRLTGEGDSGPYGGPSGDLYVSINVEKDDFFQRDEYDILCEVPISFSQAALGADIEVPTMTGKVSVKIPTGIQSGKKIRLKGKGVAHLDGRGLGDQILTIQVETPGRLTVEQRELFKKLSELEQKNSNPMTVGFFEKVRNFFH